MKIFLLSRKNFALHLPLSSGFVELGHDVTIFDPEEVVSPHIYKINISAFRFPYLLRSRWEKYFFSHFNKLIIKAFNDYSPDLVLVYNHGWLIPDTIREMKKKCKVFVYMVDSPFYTKQSHFLYNLFEADMVLAIDTAWVEQLRRIGVNKVEFGIAGADTNTFYPMKPKDDEVAAYSSDLVFLGNSPSTVSGYKRALFLSKFAGLDIRIHGGPEWKKWFENFPELNGHMVFRKEPYSFEKMNTIYNCCKIAPVDTNPGLINGVHPKIFDCIASGILPIVEHRTDSEVLFSSIGLPLIKNYNQAREIAEYYLNSENERQKKILALRNFVLKEYTSLCFAKRILGYANQE